MICKEIRGRVCGNCLSFDTQGDKGLSIGHGYKKGQGFVKYGICRKEKVASERIVSEKTVCKQPEGVFKLNPKILKTIGNS